MTPSMIIDNLRKSGHKIRIIHYRLVKRCNCDCCDCGGKLVLMAMTDVKSDPHIVNIMPNGGKTTAEILTPDGRTIFGEAVCSIRDSFNKATGIRIAVGRALAKQPVFDGKAKESTANNNFKDSTIAVTKELSGMQHA